MSTPYLPSQHQFENMGLVLRRPTDRVPKGNYVRLTNWLSVKEGALSPRFGTQKINAVALAERNIHSLGFLNDPVNVRTLAMAGAGNGLYRLDTSAPILGGFSGNPLSFLAYRATIASSPYMIVADAAQMELIDSLGAAKTLGIPFPTTPDVATVLPNEITDIDSFTIDTYGYSDISAHSCAGSFPNGVIAISGSALQVVTTATVVSYFDLPFAAPINLNFVGTLPANDDDYINLWINVDNLANLDRISLYFDIDPATVSGGAFTPSAFQTDYYYAYVMSSDMAQFVNSPTGWYQWQIRRGDFVRFGNNTALDWSTAVGYRLYLSPLSAVVTATFDELYLFGGGGADSSVGVGYDWRYTYYDSTTGSDSNPSILQSEAPPIGPGTDVVKAPVELVPQYTTNPRVDEIGHWRRGGTLPSNWQLLGRQQNVAPATIATITDDGAGTVTVTTAAAHGFKTSTVAIASIIRDGLGLVTVTTATAHGFQDGATVIIAGVTDASFDATFLDAAVTGDFTFIVKQGGAAATSTGGSATATATVIITGVTDATFDGCYETLIVVGPTTFTYQAVGGARGSTGGTATIGFLDVFSDLEIAAAQTLSLENDQPVTTVSPTGITLYGVPLPFIWGPYQGNIIFGCGDPNRPGFAYWCNPGNPDGWSYLSNVEVTQPSDPLQNGFYWAGQPWVFSKENLFQLWPGMLGVPNQFVPVPTSCGKGLPWSPWAFAAGPDTPAIWGLGKAEIFETAGGPGVSITEDDLWPIFHGLAVETYMPIDFTQTAMLRMGYKDEEVLFMYQDVNQGVNLLAYHHRRRRWRHAAYWYNPQCIFAPPESGNALWLGGSNGFAYLEVPGLGGDDQQPISMEVRTGAYDAGYALRAKEYGHFILDADPQAATLVVNILFNEEALNPFTFNFSGVGRQPLPQSLGDYYALDVQLDVTAVTSAQPTLYGFEVDYRLDRLAMVHAEVPEDSCGIDGWKHVFDGFVTLRSTQPVTITLLADGIAIPVTATQSLNTAGAKKKIYLQFEANKFKVLRRMVDCPVPFTLYPEDSALHIGGWADGNYSAVPLVENVQ